MSGLRLNEGLVRTMLVNFIKEEVCKAGFSNVVVGLSGGVDSSLVAYLAVEALSASHVKGAILPYRTSAPESIAHATLVAKTLNISVEVIDVTPMVEPYFQRLSLADPIRRGNKISRERMSILYDLSAALPGLVIGTSNKSELLLGYGTLHGDMACAINPIGDLYKTQVWQLAKAVGVPSLIVEKPPSADLWVGQTDEQELGYSYHQIDQLLYYMVDMRCDRDELISLGFVPDFIDLMYSKVQRSQFKRRLPLIAKVSD